MRVSPDERIHLVARAHGVVLVRPFAHALMLVLAGAALVTRGWPVSPAGAAALVAAAVVGLRAVWRWERTRLVVTSENLLLVEGTLRRRTASIRLDRVEAVAVEQSLAGRVLDYGTLTAGEVELAHVAQPARVRALLDDRR